MRYFIHCVLFITHLFSGLYAIDYLHTAFSYSQGLALIRESAFAIGSPSILQIDFAWAGKRNREIHYSPSISFIAGTGYEYDYWNSKYQVTESTLSEREYDISFASFTYSIPIDSMGRFRIAIGVGPGLAIKYQKTFMTRYPNGDKEKDTYSKSKLSLSFNGFFSYNVAIFPFIHMFAELRAKIGDYDIIKGQLGIRFVGRQK